MTHASPDAAPRRQFLHAAVGAATVLAAAAGTAGCQGGQAGDRALQFTSLAAASDEVMRLTQAAALGPAPSGAWNWAQTLVHCAQSIEYSMTGYPSPRSALFQRTVGAAAFGVFSWRGRMSHDLAEPIPGAPALAAGTDAGQALARLQGAIRAFAQWAGPLQPHFAYGALDKVAYERAHAMHLANHLSALTAKA